MDEEAAYPWPHLSTELLPPGNAKGWTTICGNFSLVLIFGSLKHHSQTLEWCGVKIKSKWRIRWLLSRRDKVGSYWSSYVDFPYRWPAIPSYRVSTSGG